MKNNYLISSHDNNSLSLYNTTDKTSLLLQGSFILLEDNCYFPFQQVNKEHISITDLRILENYQPKAELLLVGCGEKLVLPSPEVRMYINSLGLKLEWVKTTSAIHTYNLLRNDDRDVVAIFIF